MTKWIKLENHDYYRCKKFRLGRAFFRWNGAEKIMQNPDKLEELFYLVKKHASYDFPEDAILVAIDFPWETMSVYFTFISKEFTKIDHGQIVSDYELNLENTPEWRSDIERWKANETL